MDQLISPSAREVLEKARERHYHFRVVGEYGTLASPVFKDGWWYLPEDNPIIDENALQRVELVQSITPIRGYVIAHEAPSMLCPPKEWETPKPQETKPLKTVWKPETGVDWPVVWEVTKTILKVVGAVTLGVLYVLAMALSALAQVDPKLIVVLEDGTWMEVMTWYE